ncbi:hypothetical protein ACFXG4_30410 [Nocardia sp. NPDC059246]|uniref:hypothetical protein n=1 Tax=unclassified Nocardia TaxID=2637762 RepID=UPI00368C4CBD
MAAKGFGDLSPDTATTTTDPATQANPAPGPRTAGAALTRHPGRLGLVALGLIVVLVAVFASRCGSDSTDHGPSKPQWTVRAAHGPTRVVDNVPAGYSRDREGAASAAVNAVQALAQAGQGRIDMRKVVAVLVAAHPGPQVSKSIEVSRDRARDEDVLNVLPVAVSVISVSDTAAQVSVWTMGVARASIAPGDPVSVTTVWSTHTVSLIWESDDWKVEEKTGRVGPSPDEVVAPNSGSPLTKPLLGGYYSFYVD